MYEMEDAGQFFNDEKMFVPLTIDDLEMESRNYFFSGKKFIIMALSLLPYITIFFFLDYIPNIQVFIIYTILYLIVYSFILRFAVFEESRQKEQMRELENNKYSDLAYFWQLDKIGSGKRDDGLLYIQSDGLTIRRAYMVEVDSGSTIGVPVNAYANYREVWQKFYRMCYNLGFEIKMYNVRKKPELSDSLKQYSLQMQDIENEAYRNLMQLNVETNFLYAVSEEQRYITYIEVINKRVDNLINFRNILEDIISKTFDTDGLFANPKVLDKQGVDSMMATYFGQDRVNSNGVHRTNGYKSIMEYADIVNLYDDKGKSVPFELEDLLFEESRKNARNVSNNKSIEELMQEESEDKHKWEDKVADVKDHRVEQVQRLRREEKISYAEYEERMRDIEVTLNPETATEEDLLDEKARVSLERQRIVAEKKQARREQRMREKEKVSEEDTSKWYDEELPELNIPEEDRYGDKDIEVGILDVSLEELLGEEEKE